MSSNAADRIATIIGDYRQGEIAKPTAAHVERWVRQFPKDVRDPVLEEMVHILDKSYISRAEVIAFLKQVVTSEKLVGDDPAGFWRNVGFLRLQTAGNSQKDMLVLLDTVLDEAFGFTTADCGKTPALYLYLDDGIFSGGRIKADLSGWIRDDAPAKAKVAVVTMVSHTGGQYYAETVVKEAARDAGKTIDVTWWRAAEVEDRRKYMDSSDVLRPSRIPAEAKAYVGTLKYAPALRTGTSVGSLGLFSSAAARDLIEQEFLKGGIEVRERCSRLGEQMRPLGSTWLQTTGFGTMFVTYRNIANNTPLVLWAGDPWYPLFPRKTN